MEDWLLSKEEKEFFWDTLSKKLEEQLQYIESLRNTNPLDFLNQRKLENLFQDNQVSGSSTSLQYHSFQSLNFHIPSFYKVSTLSVTLPRIMAARFSPLDLPAQLYDLPRNDAQRIKTCGAKGDITTQQHLDQFNDFIDFEEVDYEDIKMRLLHKVFLVKLRNGLGVFQ